MIAKAHNLFEPLESRQFFSSHHSISIAAPAPLNTPAISVKRRHHHSAAAAPAPIFQVPGGIAGSWSGGHQAPGGSFLGDLSLTVRQSTTGDFCATLVFNRPGGIINIQSQFRVDAAGNFSLQIVSAKIALKFTGTIYVHATRTTPVITLNGNLQYWDKKGTYLSTAALTRQ